ncbi:MAG: hypothetical protein J0L92_10600 [Deltaproteobacteria bacterium]|nr:hypothetical protein [Deltaproteobacteria bacterium]
MLCRVVRDSFASSLVLLALLQLGCAESDSCSTDRECSALHYCGSGRCQQDCTLNAQCGAGGLCTSTGRCATAADDAGLRDDAAVALDAASAPDAAISSELDAAMVVTADAFTSEDAQRPDAFVPDSSVPLDAHAPADASVPIDAFVPIDAGTDAFVPPDASGGPLRPSTYTYTRVAVGGLGDAHVVAFHPDGSYAIVLERSNGVHVYDWASGTATRFDLRVAGRAVTLDDLVFSADGSTAWIVGWERVGTTDTGVIITLSDAAYRRGDGALSFTRSSATTAGERITGIEIPRAPSGGPGGGHPIVLSQSGTSPYIARLRELDPATSTFSGLFVARSTGAGCDDLAFSDNEFGQWGIVLACGTNGADIYLYTEVAGVGEWRLAPGGYGNVSRTDGHPSADYALIVNWSSRYVHRHESGALRTSGASPGLVDGIWDVSFSPDGRLALITGRARGASLRGTIYEYRHDLYSAAEFTDVSIEGFGIAPYLATSSTYLNDTAFLPGCDGGLVVGGNTSAGTGMVIEFQRTDGVRCR